MAANSMAMAAVSVVAAISLLGGLTAYALTIDEGESGTAYERVETIDGLTVKTVAGDPDAYVLSRNSDGESTVFFGKASSPSVYELSGAIVGNLVVDAGNEDLELRLNGLSVSTDKAAPLEVTSCGTFVLSACDGSSNRMSDFRAAGEPSFALHMYSDAVITGGGSVLVESTRNGGVYSGGKLTLDAGEVSVESSADSVMAAGSIRLLSGTVSVTSHSGSGMLASGGSSDLTVGKGVSLTVFSRGTGLEAGGDMTVSDGTTVSVQTSDMSKRPSRSTVFIGYATTQYAFSLKISGPNGTEWVNPSGDPTLVRHAISRSYVYEFEVGDDARSMEIYAYSSGQVQGQDSSYHAKSPVIDIGFERNSLLITQCVKGKGIMYRFADYGGPAMPDMGESGTAGMRSGGDLTISGGETTVRSQGPALASSGGDVTISGGETTAFSRSDAISAFSALHVDGGKTVLISDGEGRSAIRAGSGYVYSGGYLTALCRNSEAAAEDMARTESFPSYATRSVLSDAESGTCVDVSVDGATVCIVAMPDSRTGAPPEGPGGLMPRSMDQLQWADGGQAFSPDDPALYFQSDPSERPATNGERLAVFIGSPEAVITTSSEPAQALDANGVYWA